MDYDEIYLETEDKMEKALEVLRDRFRGIRTGRATPALVENVKAMYYGASTPIKQMANISVPDPRMIVIKPYDPSSIQEIEKAIMKSENSLNPQCDGKLVRIVVPPLSEERRKQLVSFAKETAEEAKIALRNIRRDSNKKIDKSEKDSIISEDDAYKLKDEIQELIKDKEEEINKLFDKKSEDIMES